MELRRMVEDALNNPESEHSALKIWIARIVLESSKRGNAKALDILLDRIVGKVPAKMELNLPNAPQVVITLPDNGRAGTASPPPPAEEPPTP